MNQYNGIKKIKHKHINKWKHILNKDKMKYHLYNKKEINY